MINKFDGTNYSRSRTSIQRKPIKKKKEDLNFNKFHKEVIKLSSGFTKLNINTGDILKDLNLLTLSKIFNGPFVSDKQRAKEFVKETYFDEDLDELIIKNDKDFKMIPKVKSNKSNTNIKSEDISKVFQISDSDLNKDIGLDTSIIRIDCKYLETTKIDAADNISTNISKIDYKTEVFDDNDRTTTVHDLQNLLIMMALTSQSETHNDETNLQEVYEENNRSVDHTITGNQTDLVLSEPNHPGSNNCNEITEVLKIAPFGIEISHRNLYLLKKYVRKWTSYIKRKQNIFSEQRKLTLNTFFEKLEKKKSNGNQLKDYTNKAKSQVKDFNTYQQRYKVQKHIIALQKAKLEEQNRIIEELKYNKILEASRQSVDNMREEVRKSYNEIDRQLKPKIKCLTNELKIPEVDEASLALQCLKVPQFLQRMEKRAREREEKHAMIRERRRQMEEDRIRLKQQEELSKAEMDKEEKLKRMKELREKRKKEKIESIRRKQYTERMRALRVMADLHYEKYLMINYGIRPFKKILEVKRHNVETARKHYKFQLKKNIFLHFMWYTEDMVFERNYVAEEFYRKKVLRKYFEGFKKNHYEFVLKIQVAEDYYDFYITAMIFKKFKEGIDVLRNELEIKVQRADTYFKSNLLFKTFTCWRTLPALNALKREQETRKAKWRQKVLQVVPDYTPPDD